MSSISARTFDDFDVLEIPNNKRATSSIPLSARRFDDFDVLEDIPNNKRAKLEETTHTDINESSSESLSMSNEKLQKMTEAFKTIIEV